ncbi:hypothetical protein ACR3K2_12380 [Cryptosporidium serpentis]
MKRRKNKESFHQIFSDCVQNVLNNLLQRVENGSVPLLQLLHEKLRKQLYISQGDMLPELVEKYKLLSTQDITNDEIETELNEIFDGNCSRSCLVLGRPCVGKTYALSSYLAKKKLKVLDSLLIVIRVNCIHYDDDCLLYTILQRLNEYFPTQKKMFSGHQKNFVLKEKLVDISKCGYTVVFILENSESMIFGNSNTENLSVNFVGQSMRQMALYTLADIMHSSDVNLILILTSSMLDMPDYFEKRVKSRLSQRRILVESFHNYNERYKLDSTLKSIEQLLFLDHSNKHENKNILSLKNIYNESIRQLFAAFYSNTSLEYDNILKKWKFSLNCDLDPSSIIVRFANAFLSITPGDSVISQVQNICNTFYLQEAIELFQPVSHYSNSNNTFNFMSQESVKIKLMEELCIVEHILLIGIVKLINNESSVKTFNSLMDEVNIMKTYLLSSECSAVAFNFDISKNSYRTSFLRLLNLGILEVDLNSKFSTVFDIAGDFTSIKFPLHNIYSKLLQKLNIPTVLQFWIQNKIIK